MSPGEAPRSPVEGRFGRPGTFTARTPGKAL